MTDPRDDIDVWLEGDVTPLYPPAGSLERIHHRARRRKQRRAISAAAGCAVIVAVVAIAPHLSSVLSSKPRPLAQGQTSPAALPSSGSTGAGTPYANRSAPIQARQRTTLTNSDTRPPGRFRPTSVTVVGNGTGFLGAVIGQAGTAGHCATQDCTSLAGTANYGGNWYGVSAPVTPGPDGDMGVSQLRFANPKDGWAFGPSLWETADGGWPWRQVATGGLRVTDLEAVGNRAFAVAARCTGTGRDFASDCTSFSLYTLVAGSRSWTPVAVPASFLHMTASQASSATLVISAGTTGYLLTPTGAVLSGPVSGGAWRLAGQAPCEPGPAQANGQPADAQLAAGPKLLLTCEPGSGAGSGQVTLYSSSDGASWQLVGAVPATGTATSLASATSGQVVLATTAGIYYSANGGTTWQQAPVSGSAPADGFSYVGMTNSDQGVAVPAEASLGEIFVTSNGGQAWSPAPIKD